MRATPLLLIAALAAVPALARDSRTVPAAVPDGEAVSCIQHYLIAESIVRSDRVIDFRMRTGRYYRNTLPYDCPELGFEQRFGYTTSLSVLCSTDIITVIRTSPIATGASCGLGKFQPIRLVKH